MLPLAAASGFAVIGASVGGAVLLVFLLFRSDDRAEAERRAEAEQRLDRGP